MRLSPQCGQFQEMAGITVSATSFGGGGSLMTATRSHSPQSTKKYHWSRSTNNNRNSPDGSATGPCTRSFDFSARETRDVAARGSHRDFAGFRIVFRRRAVLDAAAVTVSDRSAGAL